MSEEKGEIKEIIQNGHPTLRGIAEEVKESEFNSEELFNILDNMKSTLKTQHDGVAIAAPQIDITKRIFIIGEHILGHEKIEKDTPTVYINPKIIKKSFDRKKMDEGCLSVRPLYGKVRRASRAKIEAYNEFGEKFQVTGTGLLAQIFQHEYDHLDGILFIDKAKEVREMDEHEGNNN